MRLIVFIVASLATLTPSAAVTAFESGNSLYAMCSGEESWETAACYGFITAAADAMSL